MQPEGPIRIVRDEGRMRLWKNWANAGRALGLGPHYTTLIGAFKKNSGAPSGNVRAPLLHVPIAAHHWGRKIEEARGQYLFFM
ncbi:hypothetical protein C1H46_007787 [Malus baccata]|uniref:Uncharacterized protein n=1 Tax=Malus baccata TaxID=106549 RepID=A0A540N677_MALBA|nr:hypothetical protein C1H46_007787 [Malus baccata]